MWFFFICVSEYGTLYFIADTQIDKEKDNQETVYMLQENGEPMYDKYCLKTKTKKLLYK